MGDRYLIRPAKLLDKFIIGNDYHEIIDPCVFGFQYPFRFLLQLIRGKNNSCRYFIVDVV